MEIKRSETENRQTASATEEFFPVRYTQSISLICPACGAEARRASASFCLVCGKILREDYEPLDRLRASYRMQGKSFDIQQKKQKETINLFEENKNSVSQTAWACLVYSLVPYLGILFVPLAFFVGGLGIVVARRRPHLGGHKLSAISFVLSFVVLGVQIFLWWLLYIIPELGRQI